MSNRNIFDSKKRATIPRRDVVEGLGALSRHYDNEVSSANNRANNAESRAEYAERKANNAESRAEYAERKANNKYKGNNTSDSGDLIAELLIKLVGGAVVLAGVKLVELVKDRKSKKS